MVKSRYAILKPLVKSIANAQEAYYLANNTYASKFQDLDITPPTPIEIRDEDSRYIFKWGYCKLSTSNILCSDQRYEQIDATENLDPRVYMQTYFKHAHVLIHEYILK